MIIKPELMDWKQLETTAIAIIRKAKIDLAVWIPVLEQVKEEIKKCPMLKKTQEETTPKKKLSV